MFCRPANLVCVVLPGSEQSFPRLQYAAGQSENVNWPRPMSGSNLSAASQSGGNAVNWPRPSSTGNLSAVSEYCIKFHTVQMSVFTCSRYVSNCLVNAFVSLPIHYTQHFLSLVFKLFFQCSHTSSASRFPLSKVNSAWAAVSQLSVNIFGIIILISVRMVSMKMFRARISNCTNLFLPEPK